QTSAAPVDRPIRAPRPLITDRPGGAGRLRARRPRPQTPQDPAPTPEPVSQPEPTRPAATRRPRPALEPELDPRTPPHGVRRIDSTRVDGPGRPVRTRVDSTRVPPADPQPDPAAGRQA